VSVLKYIYEISDIKLVTCSRVRSLRSKLCRAYNCWGEHCSKRRGGSLQWRERLTLRSEPGRKPCLCWVSPVRLWRWPAQHPHRPADRWRMCNRRIPHRSSKSSSVRRNSRTSACRPSTSSTRRMRRNRLGSAIKSPGVAGAVAADAGVAAAGAVGVAAAVAAVAAAAAGAGGVAAPAEALLSLSTVASRHGRVLLDPASAVFIGRAPCCGVAGAKPRLALLTISAADDLAESLAGAAVAG
jgi:hypothetical protein